ncbi:MAG: glycosyltransferase family 39 protein [Nitrospirae bacterium]|nr:glycosyltransferase family 39 protein [Nitrospirota bacterium]
MDNNVKSENRVRPALLLSIFLILALGIRLYISWQDFVILFQKCVVDDAFFYLNIAKNISIGKGATFDGSILTNGFHPVYALLLVPLFLLFPDNPDLTFHLALTLCSVFNVMTGIIIFLIVKELAGEIAGLIASFLWLFNPYVILISLNGVEVSVATFFLSLCIYQFVRMRETNAFNTRGLTLLGILTALAILGRVDSVFMMISLTLFLFHAAYKEKKKLIPSLARPALFNLAAFSVLAPWFAWNLYHFGSIRQISGVTLPNVAHNMYLMKYETYLSLSLLKTELLNLKIWLESIVRFGGGFPFFVGVLLIFIWTSRDNFTQKMEELLSLLRKLNFTVLSSLLLISFYAFYFWGWFRPWYYLSVILTVTVNLGVFAGYVRKTISAPNPDPFMKPRHLIILLLILAVYFSYRGGRVWEKGLFPFQKQLYESAVWVNENTEKDTRIGAISSGVYGYITSRTTDLLGVVNHEAYRAMREKRIFSYMKEKRLDYLVDREDMVRFFSERFDGEGFMDKLTPVKRFGDKTSDVVVYKISY